MHELAGERRKNAQIKTPADVQCQQNFGRNVRHVNARDYVSLFHELPICTRDFNTSAGRMENQQIMPVVPYKVKTHTNTSMKLTRGGKKATQLFSLCHKKPG